MMKSTGRFMKQLLVITPAGGAEVCVVDAVVLPFTPPVVTARVVVDRVVVVLVVVAVIAVMRRSTEEEE